MTIAPVRGPIPKRMSNQRLNEGLPRHVLWFRTMTVSVIGSEVCGAHQREQSSFWICTQTVAVQQKIRLLGG